ncbi:dof zinc finger protein DOF3.1-like [Nicotiana sylvestris]|uniref:dof zinc finger protein DOF3.1-like n=1 Tax=Nicotiana sylvestris TaxID=4096 RepID=UPI00388C69B8
MTKRFFEVMYNLTQKRYWTKGGTLRNISVGGGSRNNTTSSNKKISSSTTLSSVSSSKPDQITNPKPEPFGIPAIPAFDQNCCRAIGMTNGQFSSLLESSGPQLTTTSSTKENAYDL